MVLITLTYRHSKQKNRVLEYNSKVGWRETKYFQAGKVFQFLFIANLIGRRATFNNQLKGVENGGWKVVTMPTKRLWLWWHNLHGPQNAEGIRWKADGAGHRAWGRQKILLNKCSRNIWFKFERNILKFEYLRNTKNNRLSNIEFKSNIITTWQVNKSRCTRTGRPLPRYNIWQHGSANLARARQAVFISL